MEFDDHDDHEEEEAGEPEPEPVPVPIPTSFKKPSASSYRECLKNHAVNIGGHAVDGCGEFMPAGEEGTLDGLKCAACGCHRNFHRKDSDGGGGGGEVGLFHHHHHHHHPHHHQFSSPYYRAPAAGYIHMAAPHLRASPALALPSTSGGGEEQEDDVSNPSSGGGGVVGKKRFRTKFTADQKEKMLAFAEGVGWRIQKQDEAAVQEICREVGVKRHVLKVWMHNNKHTLGKKP